jgi:transcriptional coactivator HFI1/ADA1
VQRIDYEPIYVQLRQAIGDKDWQLYKESVGSFVLGRRTLFVSISPECWICNRNSMLTLPPGALNQTELSRQIDSIILTDPRREHLHNQFIAAIYGNASRDPPEPGVASWVSANDKPSTAPKPVAGDGAEQRLKTEVMQLTGRERRRLKQIQEVGWIIPKSLETLSNKDVCRNHWIYSRRQ